MVELDKQNTNEREIAIVCNKKGGTTLYTI